VDMNAADDINGSGTLNYIVKFTGSKTIGNSVIYEFNSKIGIGTASPSWKLEIAGGMNISNILFVNTTSNNVGIGITAPSTKLHVSGNAKFNTGPTNGRVDISTPLGYPGIAIFDTTGTQRGNIIVDTWGLGLGGSLSQLYINTTSGNVGIGTSSPTEKLDVSGNMKISKEDWAELHIMNPTTGVVALRLATAGSGTGEDQLLFDEGDDNKWQLVYSAANDYLYLYDTVGSKEILRAYDNGDLSLLPTAGNLGVGTTSPGAKLEISGASSNGLAFNGSGILYINTTSARVGIGTTVPEALLHIFGSDKEIWLTDTAVYPRTVRFGIGGNLGDGNPGLHILPNSTDGTAPFGFKWTTGSGNSVIITDAGNVGIGTTNPKAKLEIKDGASNGLAMNVSNVLFVNSSSSNVGIGTSLPLEKLEVSGAIKLGDTTSVCDASHRGVMKFVQGGAGVDDKLYICMKNSTDAYNWVLVASGG